MLSGPMAMAMAKAMATTMAIAINMDHGLWTMVVGKAITSLRITYLMWSRIGSPACHRFWEKISTRPGMG